jgi:hypothetical protein
MSILMGQPGRGAALEATKHLPLNLPVSAAIPCGPGWGPCWDEAERRAALPGGGKVVAEYLWIIASPDAPCQAVVKP